MVAECVSRGSARMRYQVPGLSAAMSHSWRTHCAPRDRVMTFGAASGMAVGLAA